MTNTESDKRGSMTDWMTIKVNTRKSYPLGENRTNVWNHEWTDQFYSLSKKDRGAESVSLTSNKKYWDEEMIPLFKEENPDWETNEDTYLRLQGLYKISEKYN
ncbi:MAG: hypothetical protein HN726_05810 [Candidatus Magasanikbacteria bacterium]|nr:hypothetical protein [Candidatus Magasanikbacteria bacterium]